jgi:ligand-binding SRPBCC domain-containing protein
MRLYVLERTQFIPQCRAEVFVFFAEAGNLQRITPAFLSFRMLTPLPIHMRPGALIDYQLRLFGLPFRWRTRIATFAPPDRFTDVQVRGPYRYWHHLHEFRPVPGGTEVIDRVKYAMPCGPCGTLAHALCVRRLLERIFDYRRERLQALFSPGGATSLPGACSGQDASAVH